jgi:hypothetical protein
MREWSERRGVQYMSLCARCGQPLFDRGGLCAYHISSHGDDWATGNRIICNFVHRGIVLPTLSEAVDHSIEFLVDRLEAALSA